jgi:heterodisulfide reductase subunit A
MYSLKTAHLVREKTGAEVYEMYIDMRTGGKGHEEFYDRLLQEGVLFIRGKGAAVTDVPETEEERGRLVVKVEDTLLGVPRRIPVDMVVLSCAIVPRKDSLELARVLRLGCTGPGWFAERHPKLAPVSTPSDGIFIAGCCQGPKDIPDSVAQGAAAAAQAMSLLGLGHVNVEPVRAEVDEAVCSGCRICVDLCPYQAIEFNQEKLLAHVNDVLCKACGVCVAACPSGALDAKGFTDEQIFAEIEGALRILPTPALELAGR